MCVQLAGMLKYFDTNKVITYLLNFSVAREEG